MRPARCLALFGLLLSLPALALKPCRFENDNKPELIFTIGFAHSDARVEYVNCILGTALDELGYRLRLVSTPSGREIFHAVDGRADGISATIGHELWPTEVNSLIRLPDPFVWVRVVLFAHQGLQAPQTWQAINNSDLSVVYVRHHYSAKEKLTNIRAIDVDSVIQAIRLFNAKRADLLISFEAGDEISNHPELQQTALEPRVTLGERILYTYVAKQHQALVPDLNRAIQKQLLLHPWHPLQEQKLR